MTTATQTFSLSAIGQIFIRARDLDRAVHFYRDTLGMPFLFQAPPQMAFFQCGATTVMLGVPEAPELDHPASLVYYLVPDIAAAHTALRGRGVEFISEPHLVHRAADYRSEEHTSELQSRLHLVCRLLLEKKKTKTNKDNIRLT